jgi:hypothetical protein
MAGSPYRPAHLEAAWVVRVDGPKNSTPNSERATRHFFICGIFRLVAFVAFCAVAFYLPPLATHSDLC